LEWRGRAVQAAETLREKYHAKRVAITGALASPQPFTFWSQPAMAVWGVSSESMQQVYKEFTALNMDVFEADGHWFQRQLDNGEMRIEDI
jgi:hypothetical protein